MQAVLLGFVYAVFLQDSRAAAAVSYSEYGAVYGKNGIVTLFKLMVMTHGSNILRSIVKSREGERRIYSIDTERLSAFLLKHYRGTLSMVSTVLRNREMGILFGDRGLPQRYMA